MVHVPDVIIDNLQNRNIARSTRQTIHTHRGHESDTMIYRRLMNVIRKISDSGPWSHWSEFEKETAVAVAQRTASRLLKIDVHA